MCVAASPEEYQNPIPGGVLENNQSSVWFGGGLLADTDEHFGKSGGELEWIGLGLLGLVREMTELAAFQSKPHTGATMYKLMDDGVVVV